MAVNIYNDILEVVKYQIEVAKTRNDIDNNVIVCDERSFKELQNTDYSDTIFAVVQFQNGEINPEGSVLLSLNFEIYSEEETFENARTLFTYLTQNNSFVSPSTPSGTFVRMFYSTPQMNDPFAEDGANYRATFTFTCTIFYGVGVSGITNLNISWGENYSEDVKFITFQCGSGFSNHTANKGNKNDRATTVNATLVFYCSFNIISDNSSDFVSLVDDINFGSADINTELTCTFTKGDKSYTKVLKFSDIDFDQTDSGLPIYVIGLGE